MKVYVTGHTRGLGKELHNWFSDKGYEVQGFSHTNGYNLENDFDDILKTISKDSLFINNAYANGIQEKFIHALHNKVSKMIVMGSIAARFPDIELLEYSNNKKKVEEAFYKYASHAVKDTDTRYLMLDLTSSSYKNLEMIKNTITFWLDNPGVLQVGYNVK